MTDIVERLGNLIECEIEPAQNELYATAKAEIEKLREELVDVRADAALLRADNDRLRALVKDLADDLECELKGARRALEHKP